MTNDMIIDALDQAVDLNRDDQVCIVGAGPVGMILARELADVASVLVVESGGMESQPGTADLQVGEVTGLDYPLTETRARQFGGSSDLWAGYCALFDAHDFEPRPWVPGSGWPFGVQALERYYQRVAGLLNLGDPEFDARRIAARTGTELPFDDETTVPTVWRFGTPTLRIGDSWRTDFERSTGITTLINANVVDVRLDAGHSDVTELVVRTLDGREGRIRAGLFVLACGGIETARLLLNADTQLSAGLGNRSGLVGRCFMEHPHLTIDSLRVIDVDRFGDWLAQNTDDVGRRYLHCVGLSAAVQADLEILNARGHIFRTPDMAANEAPKVGMFLEQAPNRDSRITLTDARDAVGMRRIRLDWRVTDLEWRTFEKSALLLARAFERIGAGRLQSSMLPRDDARILHSNHHLGTTRMSADPAAGVTDGDCRLHDCSNLYIAGGSVFPTVSWANPTFTLMALVFRLAAHLRTLVDPGGPQKRTQQR